VNPDDEDDFIVVVVSYTTCAIFCWLVTLRAVFDWWAETDPDTVPAGLMRIFYRP